MSLILKLKPVAGIRFCLKTLPTPTRYVCTTPKNFSLNNRLRRIGSPVEVERALKETDKIPKEFELIYRSGGRLYLSGAKYCVMFSTAVVVGLAVWEILSSRSLASMPVPDLVYGNLVAKESDLIYFAAGFILINLAFSALLWRFPIRIYKNVDKYIAIYESQLPFRGAYQHTFSKGEVREVRQLLNPWKESYYRLGNRNSILFEYYFKTPSEFHQMF